ncbi:RasGEF domain-containing protein [Halteromyces radiatus]|uniref:RasGEF domain-containing protein n=1 Tax=Halteromyces radiatus TaxID=101107 RepID=UPI00221E7486|nr:RasGEF domain-containing protein [Halteromyces radiatus]KAI8089645.1 RasGEF domain-containing protein [Halteromyces radiatus]
MQSVQAATALYWTPDTLAKQIAIIDCQLFSMVKLETSLLCQLDLVNSQLDRLLDFHHYLSHSFAHQLIFWSSLSKTTTSTVIPPVQPKDNLISHLVQVAHRLLHIYRDFSGFAAIMKALMLPQVQRLRSLWKNCPSRIKELFSEMVPILSSDQQYQAYHNILYQKLSYFFFTPSSTLDSKSISKMVVIPWMQPHLLSLRSIVTDYAAIGDDHATLQQTSTTPSKNHLCHQTTSNIELVLSAPGLQKLAVIMALLEQCQTCVNTNNNNNNNNKNNKNNNNSSSSRRSSRHSMHPTTNKSNTSTTVHDLHTLSPGDLLVHHWLVSRVYLRRDQLVDESIQVQPLLPGEQLVCDAFASDDGALEILLRKKLDTTSRQHLTDNKHHTQSTNPASPRSIASSVSVVIENPSSKQEKEKKDQKAMPTSTNNPSKKSKLSPTAPEFVPLMVVAQSQYENVPSSEEWNGYPTPVLEEEEDIYDQKQQQRRRSHLDNDDDDDDDDEIWTGYPGPQQRHGSMHSIVSDEWKGYEATKEEATWELETALKMKQRDWQGYTLETLNEQELDGQ